LGTYFVGNVELLHEVTLEEHAYGCSTRVFVRQVEVDELKAATSQITSNSLLNGAVDQ
jgi:hypothetical protein